MRRRLVLTAMISIVFLTGCDSDSKESPDAQQTQQAKAEKPAEQPTKEKGATDNPQLTETVERAEPTKAEGSACDNPAKLTKLAANTILTADGGGCYLIENEMEVRGEKNKLTIEPGVTIKFAENAGLRIHKAALEAKGTNDKPIVLTGQRETPGFWKGIAIRGSNHVSNALEHVTIEYAGNSQTFDDAEPAALMFDASRGHNSFSVKHTTLAHSGNYGLYAEHDLSGEFAANEVTNNEKAAAYVHPASIRHLDSASTFAGNKRDNIDVWGAEISNGQHQWPAVGVPYRVSDTVEFRGGTHLVLDPGVEIHFDENAGLYMHKAKLSAAGTEQQPITLTGHRQVKGFWKGVAMRGSDSIDNALKHVTISHAGSDAAFDDVKPAGLMLDESRGANSLKVQNCTFSNNGGYGLYSEHDVDLSFANNTLTANKEGAARVHPTILGQLDSASTYSGNETDRLSVWGSTINGAEATWPAIDVPYYIEGVIELRDDSNVTIEPGATFRFAENAGLYVHKSRLKAAGTDEKPITFTGERESAGFWRGIFMRGTTSIDNQFKHVSIKYAGSSDNFDDAKPAALMLDQSRGAVKVAIDDLSVTDSGGAGLHVENEVTIESSDCATIAPDAKTRFTEGSADFQKACKKRS